MDADWKQWVGRKQLVADRIHEAPLHAMRATLDGIQSCPQKQAVPDLWHWLFFIDRPSQSQLALDGHEKRGNFMPPVSLPRRMWAASQLQFHTPLFVGDPVRRESVIESIDSKQGKSGSLVFVTIDHRIHTGSALAISEKQTIVYREHSSGGNSAGKRPIGKADFEKTIHPSTLLLFRYSALTFNSHRIHYDREYACKEEGYPGLVVHGPLLAILLLGALHEHCPDSVVAGFEFRARKAVFDLAPFRVCGQFPKQDGQTKLWIADSEGDLCMQAEATIQC